MHAIKVRIAVEVWTTISKHLRSTNRVDRGNFEVSERQRCEEFGRMLANVVHDYTKQIAG